ncbi:MAG: hypothetical protein VYC34_08110, partial [Planctomycetota bacterium]|nr:hypothetical protein [Planctomycetota bacterium]
MQRNDRIGRAALGLVAACAFAGGAHAGGLHDVDVILSVEEGAIVTSRVSGPGGATEPSQLFSANMTLFFGFPFTEDPGFQSRLSAFPSGSLMRLNMLDALRVWENGNFDSVAALPLEIEFGMISYFSSSTPGMLVTGPTFSVTPLGDVHVHPFHYLDPNAEDGLYLMQFEIESNAAIDTTAPFFWIYDWNASAADLAAAQEWVRSNLLMDPCPADLDGEGVVAAGDLATLLGSWGAGGGGGPADFDD